MSSDTLSPELQFPFDELEKRIQYIQSQETKLHQFYKSLSTEFQNSGDLGDSEEKSTIDEAEFQAGNFLYEMILSAFPDDSILSEGQESHNGKNYFQWVLDPIDGSINFLRKIPLYAVSLGLQHRGSNAAGIILVPGLGDIYYATRTRGAYKNGNRIAVSDIAEMEHSVLVPGYPQDRKKQIRSILAELSSVIVSGKTMRRSGSFCLDMCWLAEGRFDGLWENNLSQEDTTAASIILLEAGGSLTDDTGVGFSEQTSNVVASNSHIQKNLVTLLQKSHRDIHLN
ncbi:MAG: inositol monophosphatase family protein [Spirochaetota bacterium]